MEKYLREDIKKLKAYQVNQVDFDVKLDANEGFDWLNGNNRYPDDYCTDLREKLAIKLGKDKDEILFGNGSSELIELLMKAYLESGESVLSFSPSFSMYKLYTIINKGVYEEFPLEDMAYLNVEGFIDFIKEKRPKIVIICNPNNPTGSVISRADILKIVQATDGMVILDEAYIEFSDMEIKDDTREYKNLIVLRTFSKAYALAGIRLGYMIGHSEIIDYINRVRSPYNINSYSQSLGIKALENEELLLKNIEITKRERARVQAGLEDLGLKVYPSSANFIFFRGNKNLYSDLVAKKVLIRNFGGELEGYYRITIGPAEENNLALEAIKEALSSETGRN